MPEEICLVVCRIGVPEDTLSQRTIEVWNKIDRVPQREVLELMHDAAHDAEVRREQPPTCSPPGLTTCSVRGAQASVAVSPQTVVPVSATEGTGLERLMETVEAVYQRPVAAR